MGAVKNHFHDEICAGEDDDFRFTARAIEALDREVADLADELIYGGGLRNNGDVLAVVERADNSDPHYRLCGALERRRAFHKAAAESF